MLTVSYPAAGFERHRTPALENCAVRSNNAQSIHRVVFELADRAARESWGVCRIRTFSLRTRRLARSPLLSKIETMIAAIASDEICSEKPRKNRAN
jgi:hypothetical protein